MKWLHLQVLVPQSDCCDFSEIQMLIYVSRDKKISAKYKPVKHGIGTVKTI